MEGRVYREGNRVVFEGAFKIVDVHRPLACMHQAVQDAGYSDIVLDFKDCTQAYAGPMLALCAQSLKLRAAHVDTDIILPADGIVRRLFGNTNWAHLLCPRDHEPSSFRSNRVLPATRFTNPSEQQAAVNRIVDAILASVTDIAREDFAALEWSVNELTDNVLVHSQSAVGGLVQVTTFQKTKKRIEFVVADAGLGIPQTLRKGHPEMRSDTEALNAAIREGVTRDKSVGQGNGLFGSYEICSQSKGYFYLESGHGKLVYNDVSGLHVTSERVPYEGTLVISQIDFSVPHLLEKALTIGGKQHRPTDFVEIKYEGESTSTISFLLKEHSNSFGSRVAGTPVRTKLVNLAKMCPEARIVVDLSEIPLVSSSFADEVFGKLFLELGPMTFMQRFELKNSFSTVKQLIDKAIMQRMSTGA